MFRKNELRCQSQPLPKHRQPLGMLQAFFARGHDVEEAVLGKFRQQSSAATRPCQVQWKEQKNMDNLNTIKRSVFPCNASVSVYVHVLLAINGQRVFHSNGWINPRPDVMQKKQPGPCIMYGGTEAKRVFLQLYGCFRK